MIFVKQIQQRSKGDVAVVVDDVDVVAAVVDVCVDVAAVITVLTISFV